MEDERVFGEPRAGRSGQDMEPVVAIIGTKLGFVMAHHERVLVADLPLVVAARDIGMRPRHPIDVGEIEEEFDRPEVVQIEMIFVLSRGMEIGFGDALAGKAPPQPRTDMVWRAADIAFRDRTDQRIRFDLRDRRAFVDPVEEIGGDDVARTLGVHRVDIARQEAADRRRARRARRLFGERPDGGDIARRQREARRDAVALELRNDPVGRVDVQSGGQGRRHGSRRCPPQLALDLADEEHAAAQEHENPGRALAHIGPIGRQSREHALELVSHAPSPPRGASASTPACSPASPRSAHHGGRGRRRPR